MRVQFQFDFPRTLAAITYIASHPVPVLTTYKTLKILFFADKYHLVLYGRTITGDGYAALEDGPVPSRVYNILKELRKTPYTDEGRRLLANLHVDKSLKYPIIRAKAVYDADDLSRSDIKALDHAINEVGQMGYTQLREKTHEIAAYDKAWKSKRFWQNSVPMKFEDFFDDDPNAAAGAKEEMIENDQIRKALA